MVAKILIPEELDLIEELRLRRWARENYVPVDRRDSNWHPVVHEEMKSKDVEAGNRKLTA